MKNLVLSLLVCFPAVIFAQNPSECSTAGDPVFGGCCYDCTCYTCSEVDACDNTPGSDYALCVPGGCGQCGVDSPGIDPCGSWTENYYAGSDEGCVPIDGGLGFLIAGGLGMGVLGVRRRKELELEA